MKMESDMFKVMSDGMVHSQHEIRKDAEDEIQHYKDNTKQEIQDLMDEIYGIQEYADSLTIKET